MSRLRLYETAADALNRWSSRHSHVDKGIVMQWTHLTTRRAFWLATAMVVLSASQLVGCGTPSRAFVRPGTEDVTLGKTRYADIIAKYGSPSEEYMVGNTKPPLRHVSYTYLRAEEGAVMPGIVPVRSIAFYFHEDTLVGESFFSTLKSDHTNFDETQRSKIERGKTRLSEVAAILGRPAQRAIDPLGRNKDRQLTIGYHFLTVTDSMPSKATAKQLTIFIGADDVVTDVQYDVGAR